MGRFDEVVQSQCGVLTRSQAIDFLGKRDFERRVARGDLVRVFSGIYRVAGAPATDRQRLFIATIAYRGTISHRGAAALRGFNRYKDLRPELTVGHPIGSRDRKVGLPITIHRTTFLPQHHIEVVDGLSVTSASRTACDLSVFLSAPSLGRIIDDGVRRGLLTYEGVATCRREMRRRGRRRTTVIDKVLEDRGIEFDPGESAPELDVRTWLEDAGICPVVQHPVIINGKRRRLDLALPEPMIAIEYQGLDSHGLPANVIDDSARTTELQLAGWLVVLITKGTGRRRAVEMVREALALRGR